MHGLRHEHENERQHERNDVNPKSIPDQLGTQNADKSAAYVTAEQRARLGGRCARQTE
jgi:hypothetical protein